MNSKQRRVDRRCWKYSVITYVDDYDNYTEMWSWLKQRHGTNVNQCGWRDRHLANLYTEADDTMPVKWEFIREKDALEFALKWI